MAVRRHVLVPGRDAARGLPRVPPRVVTPRPQVVEVILETSATALEAFPLLQAWHAKAFVAMCNRRSITRCSRAEPKLAAFLASDKRKPPAKWGVAGDPYYESVKRTIPDVVS